MVRVIDWSEDTVKLAAVLAEHGVDLDVSSGGNSPDQQIQSVPGYQVPFAAAVKKVHGDKILVSTVSAIYKGKLAQSILISKSAKRAVMIAWIGYSSQNWPES
ncbi:hypothetical protein BD311DRAFT_807604 [Dichomitus squalens]|uniref:Uncharacterized protein n=1 Tax=Dichomitus squalens TaxID=114155 RepID=A0A4Q9MJE1_9APHY|nr:hypothetical protein BD311DRAFT_807604 [Dichomitus squalens]